MGLMSEKPRQHFLNKKEAKIVLQRASEKLDMDLVAFFNNRLDVEVYQVESDEIYLINGQPALVKAGESIYPTLRFDEYLRLAPTVVVDMGAVPYVCKGANVMAPGVRRIEGRFEGGSIVVVVDEKHGKPLALGEILYDSEEATRTKQGILVKNLYYVGDKTWNLMKVLTSKIHEKNLRH
jgi:PUA domain protein